MKLLVRIVACLVALACPPTLLRADAEDTAAVVEQRPEGAVEVVKDQPQDSGAESAGQADLDAAIDAKLSAKDLEDFATVIDLCKRALKKGLAADSRTFAENLYTGTLIDRAGMVVEAIFATSTPDPQWPRMRSFALRDLNEALERDPKLGEAQLMLARLEALPGGDRARARTAAQAAIDLLGDDKLRLAQAHVVRGNLEDGDTQKQAADYDKAVELAPRDKDVRRTRGLFHLLKDDFEKCREDLLVAIEVDPDDASLHEALGMAYMMDEKLAEAEQSFDKAIEIDPTASNALLQRARVLAQKGEQPKAIADLDKAISISPDDAIPLVLRARIHQQAGNAEQAARDLERVLEKQPDHPAALELRGLIAADRHDYPLAIRDFRKLVAKNGDDPLLVGQLGMLYLAAKQPREAIRRFSRALELDEDQFLSRRGRSDAEISIGDHKAAIADLEKALALEPDDSGVLNNLAWLLATSPDDSIRDGKRAIELATKACEETEWKQAHIISTLAAGHAEAGDFAKAREFSRRAVETADANDGDAEVRQQLSNELASYESSKPWREKQSMEEAALEQPQANAIAPEAGPADDGDAADRPVAEKTEPQPHEKRSPRRPFD
jgi:tetratricopeptide (TPR) repeat protein